MQVSVETSEILWSQQQQSTITKTRKVWNNMVNLRIFSDTDSLPEINKNGNLSNKQWNKIGKFVDFDTS